MNEYKTKSEFSTIFHHPAWFSVLKKSYGIEVIIVGCSQSTIDSKNETKKEKIEDRWQKSEVGSRKTEDGSQKTEGGRQKTEVGSRKSEDGRQKSEGGRQNLESGRSDFVLHSSDLGHLTSVKKGIPFVVKKNKFVSLPFSDYVSLLDVEETDLIISNLLKKNPDAEIEIRDKYEGIGFNSKLIGYRHILNLTQSEEQLFSSFKKTQVQQPITQAQKYGLIAKVETDIDAINKFYELHLLTRKKLGVPIQPKKFFYYLLEEIIKKDLGYLINVYNENDISSSGIFIGFDKNITYKFSASHPKYLKYRPNNLMLWNGILEAKRRGYEFLDFGRTDLADEGLRKFKLGWGTIEEPLYYSYYPKLPSNSNFNFIKDKIVKPIIKHSPKFVCRLSGELLYKYFG